MMHRPNLSKQRGIGLLELMLSLAIIAVLLIMATRYFASTSQSQKVNQAINDFNAIQAAVANLKAGNPAAAVSADAISPWMPSYWNDGAEVNPWGGDYTVEQGGSSKADVTISMTDVPDSACPALQGLVVGLLADGSSTCAGGDFSGDFGPNRDAP